MKIRKAFTILAAFVALAATGCGGDNGKPAGNASNTAGSANTAAPAAAAASKTPAPLPDNGFRAQITAPDTLAKLRAGQKQTIQVKVKNASDVQWWARGGEINTSNDNKFYLAVGNRWFDANDALVTDMDGRYGLSKDLKPGEETEVPLLITAPKKPGDYVLELDLVQEQVAWFHEKGSPTTRVKIKVER